MNSKVVFLRGQFLRGHVAAPARPDARVRGIKATVTALRAGPRPAPQARGRLVAVWRLNPASGRPECCWTFVPGAADEGQRFATRRLLFLRRVLRASFEGTVALPDVASR